MGERLLRVGVVSGLILLGVQGCGHCCREACAPPPVFEPSPPAANLPPHPLHPYQAAPGGVWPAPPGANVPPPGAVVAPPGVAVPPAPVPVSPSAPPAVSGYGPAPAAGAEAPWRAPGRDAGPAPAPAVSTAEPPREPPRLYPPVSGEEPAPAAQPAPPVTREEPPPATQPAPPASPQVLRPGVAEEAPMPSLPVGISQFAVAEEGVTSGLKPAVYGGLDWLQAHGYRAVLHVKSPGEDDAADRQVIENHKLKYLSLDVSPGTLTPAVVQAFNRVVGDRGNRPLFVYDQSGMLAGGLWYLHFRSVDRDTDEVARLKAARLGLPAEVNADNRAMWLAIERYLAGQNL